MDRLIRVVPEVYVAAMRAEVDGILKQVMEAVNNAPDGRVISGSERPVHELMERLRQRAYQQAMQMRIDATEASFSPSERSADPSTDAKQGEKLPPVADD
jgi:hypothetical protein